MNGYTAPCGSVKFARCRAVVLVLALLAAASSVFAQSPSAPADTALANEEPRTIFVNRIIFSGNEHVGSGMLKSRMRTREPGIFNIFKKPKYDDRQIERDVAALEAYYRSIGYPDATVRIERVDLVENRRFADIYIRVVEGEPNLVRTLAFEGNLILEDKALRKDLLLEPGAPYNEALLETDIYTIRGKYYDQGYLAVVIDDSVRIENRKVDIRFTIVPRKQLHVGQISIEGNEEVRTGVIQGEIVLETGEVCRYNKVLETERNLFETGLFSVVDVVPEHVDTMTNVVDIRIRVRERKESWIEAGLGVGNILGSRVFAEWGTRNIFGFGRTVRLKAEYAFDIFRGDEIDLDEIDFTNTYYRYDAIYQQRRLFGLKLPTSLNGYTEWDNLVQGLEVSTLGAAVGVSHEFGRIRDFGRESLVTGTFSVEDIKREQEGQPEERSRSNILGSSVSRDTRDFILNPSVGSYRIATAQVAGGILGGENDFYTTEAGYQHYVDVRQRSVLAWRVRAGYADSYGRSPEVPVENRYYLGGANSVRGYGESGLGPLDANGNPSGGTFMLLANVEYRYPFPFLARWNFTGSVFLDSGNVWDDPSDVSTDDFEFTSAIGETTVEDYRYGAGVGIRYNTPVGPVRLDWGFPLKPDGENSRGRVYLSLGQIF